MAILQNIFSVKNEDNYKVLRVLGLKIKKRRKNKPASKTVTNKNTNPAINVMDAISVYDTHKETFKQFKNINNGKEVVILATGPSLKDYVPIEGAVHIGVNRAFQYDKVNVDYLFMQDGTAVKSYIEEANKLDIPKFYGLRFQNEEYREGVRIPECHLNNKNTYRYYFHAFPEGKINANVECYPLFSYASVSFPALHFALWTQPKKIYLVGCDSTAAPYWDGGAREEDYLVQSDKVNNIIIDGYNKVKKFADCCYPDIEIISINPVGLKGIFKDIYTQGEV